MDKTRIFETLRRNICTVVPDIDQAAIATSASLADLGCNSIDRADVLTMTMEELDIIVPIHEMSREHTLADLIALLEKHR